MGMLYLDMIQIIFYCLRRFYLMGINIHDDMCHQRFEWMRSLLDTKQAGEVLHVSVQTVRRYVKAHLLKAAPGNGKIMFEPKELERFASSDMPRRGRPSTKSKVVLKVAKTKSVPGPEIDFGDPWD
jgi:hypothetical protein